MSNERTKDLVSPKREKIIEQEDTRTLLKRRLIWQHLAQKKIKKSIKARLKMTEIDD
jgi:hypothetical protein